MTKDTVKEFFKELKFNAQNHTYKYGEKNLSSVSSVISRFVEPFDANTIAARVALQRGTTKEIVLKEWADKRDKACARGHSAHSFGENYTKGCIPKNGCEKAIMKFWDELPNYVEPFLVELQMYSAVLGIAGTADLILYNNKTGCFIIADYKTNADLFKNFKRKTLLAPFNFLFDSPYNKYQLQLSLYQILFESMGVQFKVESRKLIWLKDNGQYSMYTTEDYSQQLLESLRQ